MKNKWLFFLTGCFILCLSSCLSDNDYEYEYEVRNCQIKSITVENKDSVPEVSNMRFTIDQVNGYIYNIDSLPYNTSLRHKLVTSVEVVNPSIIASINAFPEASEDTIKIGKEEKDSIDFSKPVRIVVESVDGATKKQYRVWINVHQVNPELLPWKKQKTSMKQVFEEQKAFYVPGDAYYVFGLNVHTSGYSVSISSDLNLTEWKAVPLNGLPASGLKLNQMARMGSQFYLIDDAGSLYVSADGINWNEKTLSVSVTSLMGVLKSSVNQPVEKLSMVVKDEQGNNLFATWSETDILAVSDDKQEVPVTFPVNDFASAGYNSMHHERLIAGCGVDREGNIQNAMWVTIDGLSWVVATNKSHEFLSLRGASMAYYDNMFYLVGGIKGDKPTSDIYVSKDKGINWTKVDELKELPEDFESRAYATLIVDENNYMMIFGGKASAVSNHADEVWKGRINRLGFKKQ